MSDYENESDHGFRKLFRMERDTLDALYYDELAEVIPVGQSVHKHNMLGIEKLLMFLYCAGGW